MVDLIEDMDTEIEQKDKKKEIFFKIIDCQILKLLRRLIN